MLEEEGERGKGTSGPPAEHLTCQAPTAAATRTTLALRAWFMRTHGVDHAVARDWVSKAWPLFNPHNDTFNAFLDNEWHAGTWHARPADGKEAR